MDSPISFQDNNMYNKKTMTYVVVGIVILFVILFLIFVFNQGEEKSINLKSLFNKNKNSSQIKIEEEEEENPQEIVNKNIIEDNANDKCKNKIYKKLGNVCKGKYIPPL